MSKECDLRGQTIVFTGQPRTNEALLEVERMGGRSQIFPLIQTHEVTTQDETFIAELRSYDWLIFTSQNAVAAFEQKLVRHNVRINHLPCKIAAVGSKTAEAIQKVGFRVSFMPTIYSADVFIQQFPMASSRSERCLFIKGSLAKKTIKEGLVQSVDEWTVYETLPDVKTAIELLPYIEQHANSIVIFASPSAVEVYAREIAPTTGWNRITTAAIGHVTAAALEKHGAPVHIQPKTYTYLALIKKIAQWKEVSKQMKELQFNRHRRLRTSDTLRAMVRETYLHTNDLIYPIFVAEGENIKNPIASMPGVFQFSLDHLGAEVDEVVSLGIPSIILFGIPLEKDAEGTQAFHDHGIVQEAIRFVKERHPDLMVIADTCLCEYTDHGHCGVIENGKVLNDPTLDLLSRTAIAQAKAGADIIAPSNMMDGFVAAIRYGLDEAGFAHIPIMSYAVKYSSAYYGPFRDAANSAPQFGDRKTYQMDYANRNEAMREAASDVEEGADFLIVKPALSYLDIVRDVKNNFDLPIVAYNVSGEYAMVKAAAQNGWIDEQKIVLETLTSMKRAGADLIMTYHAKDAARWLEEK